jgi:seryl-tRNA synthetase
LFNILNEVKGWIGLAASVVAAAGWAYAVFAKQEAVDSLECRTLADARLVQDSATMQIHERRLRDNAKEERNLKHELIDLKKTTNRDGKLVQIGTDADISDIQDEVASLDREKDALEKALNDLTNETSYLSNSLVHRSCETREGRDEMRKSSNQPALTGPLPPTITTAAPNR